ncbi:MAG: VWA domain-containing protein [archaeon]|nr:MAG: VWA domain-containing protein [archaeon]
MFTIPFSDITFYEYAISYKNLNLLLVVIGLAILIHFLTIKRSEKRAIKFSNYEILEKLIGKGAARERNLLPLILRLLILSMVIFAISDFTITFKGYKSDMDFVIAMDSSSSMLNPDVEPTRLDAAKQAALDLLEKLPEKTEMGILSFSGEAEMRCGLTRDKEILDRCIKNVTYGQKGGTAIGDAIILGSTELKEVEGKRGLILITDGKNNIGVSVNESLDFAMENNITIITVGIGTGGNETEFDIPEEYRSIEGTITITMEESYDQSTLNYLSNSTSGKFYEVRDRETLGSIYEEVVLEKRIITVKPTLYLLAVAALLLLIEWALGATKYKTLP